MRERLKPPRLGPEAAEHAPRERWLLIPLIASALLITAQAWSADPGAQQAPPPTALSNTADARLSPTAHPPVPPTLDAMWYARKVDAPPTQGALASLAKGVRLLDEGGDATAALPLVSATTLVGSDVSEYARYYTGIAFQRLNRLDEADAAFANVARRNLQGQLGEAALYRQAEIREARSDYAGAVAIYQGLLTRKVASPQIALVKLGTAASAAGDRARAIDAHRRILREFATSAEAAEAERLLEALGGFTIDTGDAAREELDRGELLFKARRWTQARAAFERVRDRVEGEDRHRVTMRLAQIQAANGQHRAAREVFRRYLGHKTFAEDAQFGLVSAARVIGEIDDFKQLTEDFVVRHPTSPLTEEALNELARHYVLTDEDDKAAEIYTTMLAKFPAGAFAERAAWKAGWWAYRQKNFRETIRVFENSAATFPRSDYRPSWLYWSARAYDQLGERVAATERYSLAVTDYLNTYYGRLAWKQIENRSEGPVLSGVQRTLVTAPPPPLTAAKIARLIELGLYQPALNEVQYAQKMWGDSPPLQATLALVHNRLGNLRLGINAMKRAYPQYMTAGGEDLPIEIQHIIFPIDYWPLLKGHAQARGIDPYLLAALVAQESTFDPVIRSSADAIGLMQILPSTGRRYARKIGMRSFSTRNLTNPEISVRLGTQYFSELISRFGGAHYALAGYNAGENRVERWNDEAPGLPPDEWIDNIPFPETQNYVKRILGTAEDYRRLYGGEGQTPRITRPAPAKKSTAAPARKTPTKKAAPAKKTPARKSPRAR